MSSATIELVAHPDSTYRAAWWPEHCQRIRRKGRDKGYGALTDLDIWHYETLYFLLRQYGICHPFQKTLAEWAGVTVLTIKRSLARLRSLFTDDIVVQPDERDKRHHRYIVRRPPWQRKVKQDAAAQSQDAPSAPNRTHDRKTCTCEDCRAQLARIHDDQDAYRKQQRAHTKSAQPKPQQDPLPGRPMRDVWQQVVDTLAAESMTKAGAESWLRGAKLRDAGNGEYMLLVTTSFAEELIERRYRERIEYALLDIIGPYQALHILYHPTRPTQAESA